MSTFYIWFGFTSTNSVYAEVRKSEMGIEGTARTRRMAIRKERLAIQNEREWLQRRLTCTQEKLAALDELNSGTAGRA